MRRPPSPGRRLPRSRRAGRGRLRGAPRAWTCRARRPPLRRERGVVLDPRPGGGVRAPGADRVRLEHPREQEVAMRRKVILVTVVMTVVRAVIASASPVLDALLVGVAALILALVGDECTNA